MQCFYVVLLFVFLLGLHFVLLLYGFTFKLEVKQTVCFYIDTISFGTKSVSLISLSSRKLVISFKNQNFRQNRQSSGRQCGNV